MPGVEVNIELYCSCGAGICMNARAGEDYKGQPMFTITPCSDCIETAKEEAYSEGYDKAKDEAEVEINGMEREIINLEERLQAALDEHETRRNVNDGDQQQRKETE